MLGLSDGGALGKLSTGYASLEAVFDTDVVVMQVAGPYLVSLSLSAV